MALRLPTSIAPSVSSSCVRSVSVTISFKSMVSLSLSLHFAYGHRWLAYLAELPKLWMRHDEPNKCFRPPGPSSRRQDGLQVRPLDRRAIRQHAVLDHRL